MVAVVVAVVVPIAVLRKRNSIITAMLLINNRWQLKMYRITSTDGLGFQDLKVTTNRFMRWLTALVLLKVQYLLLVIIQLQNGRTNYDL